MVVEYKYLHWLFPIAVTLHNLEEFLWLPEFAAAHITELPWRVDSGVLRFALVLLTVAAWIITFFS